MKRCTKCNEVKAIAQFSRDKQKPDGRYSSCKACNIDRIIASYDPVKKQKYDRARRASERHYKYKKARELGVPIDVVEQVYRESNGLCEICKKPETAKASWAHSDIKKLALDHCHLTGKMRGLLCARCNTALGQFQDSVFNLNSAIHYLKKYTV